jgi:cell division protein FtsW (lipid II flippase)
MWLPKTYDLLIILTFFLAIVAIVFVGTQLDVGSTTLAWLIFGAVVVFGQAILRILASGLSEIRDALHEIRGLLRETRNR